MKREGKSLVVLERGYREAISSIAGKNSTGGVTMGVQDMNTRAATTVPDPYVYGVETSERRLGGQSERTTWVRE